MNRSDNIITRLIDKVNSNTNEIIGIKRALSIKNVESKSSDISSQQGCFTSITNHSELLGLDASDSHPISAITNLQTTLNSKLTANNAITAATKCKITYDTKGLVTGGADLVENDIPTLSTDKITGLTDFMSLFNSMFIKKPKTGGGYYIEAQMDFVSILGVTAYGNGSGGGGEGNYTYWMQDPTDGRTHATLRAVLTGGTATRDGDVSLNGHTHTKSQITDFAHTHSISDVTGLQTALDGKQTTISDLATIRSNAANGNTAYGWGNHASQGYLKSITKTMVENVLTGNITSHTHSYLPLSGGNVTGSIILNGPTNDIPFVRNFTFPSITSWTRDIIGLKVDGNTKFRIGAYGEYAAGASNNGIDYAYIGCNNYSGLNLRITASSLKWGTNAVYHQGNLTALSQLTDNLGNNPVHTHSQYLPLSGGTMSGAINMAGNRLKCNTYTIHSELLDDTSHGLTTFSIATPAESSVSYLGILSVNDYYKFQIGSSGSGGNVLKYRGYNSNTATWDNWVSVYHSGNLTRLSQLTDNLGSNPVHTHSQYLTSALAATTYHPKGGSTALPFDAKSLSLAGAISGATNITASGTGTMKEIVLSNNGHSVKIELDANGNLKINGNVLATGAVTAYQSN